MSNSRSSQHISIVRWENRKWMAWTSLAIFCCYTLLYWFALPPFLELFGVKTVWVAAIQDSYFWFATGMIAVILGYMGFTTLPFLGKNGAQVPTQEIEDYESPRRKRTAQKDDGILPGDGYVDPNFKFESKDL